MSVQFPEFEPHLRSVFALYRRAVQCHKGCVDEAWYNLGLVLRALERYDEALECFGRALAIDPQYKDARLAKRDVAKVLRLRASDDAALEM